MIHINKFGIGNFRVFKEMQEFTFAPITILTGTNSSGKSSLTKAIVLLKESMINSKLSKLDFNNSSLKLGSFEQNLNIDTKSDLLMFQVELNHKGTFDDNPFERLSSSNYSIKLAYKDTSLKHVAYYIDNEEVLLATTTNSNPIQFYSWSKRFKDITFSNKMEEVKNLVSEEDFKIIINAIKNKVKSGIYMNSSSPYDERNIFGFDSLLDMAIEQMGKVQEAEFEDQNGIHEYSHFVSSNFSLHEILEDRIKRNLDEKILEYRISELVVNVIPFEKINEHLFNSRIKSIQHISGMRMSQEIIFTFNEYPQFINLIDKLNATIDEKKYSNARYDFLHKWLVNEFKLVNTVEELQFDLIEGFGFAVKLNRERSLYQVGYGITQLLPIILQVVLLKNSVFIIEEPESNLHPALQSKLADFFIEASKEFNIQFIIETHSEYLIRKLQYLTAKKAIKPVNTQIYYFYPPNEVPEGERQVYPINIQEDGSLSKNFGKGFFDEADNIALELFLLKNGQSN